MKPYEQYKNSGIDWLGQVPSHWEIGIGMMILKENKRSNKGMKENTVLSLSYGEIIVKDESKLFGLVPESFETYQIVEPNDIIIRCTDLQNDKTSLRTGLAKNKGIITSAYLNLGVKQGYCAKFIYYYLHTLDITKVIYGLGSGLRQNLSFLDFRRLPFPLPPLPEQTAIAEFLDEKTTQIQTAIGIKNEQIAKLKEYRQALINQTVTKGLNANTPMKNSGVEWLREVPSHWEIGIGMMILKENKRSNKGMKENTILSLSYGEIIVKDESKLFGLVPESFETYQIVEPNDIIIRCTDLQNDKTSLRTGLAKNKGIITSAYLNLGVKQGYYAKFIHYYLHTLDITKMIYGLGSGLRQNLSFLDFRRLPFPISPLPEQLAIAEFLDKKTAQIDKAIAHHQNQIERLKEYQQSLVNDVVTGKIWIKQDYPLAKQG
ncbi:type I restriction-modification system specificity protein [Bibersteinia trehalosi USDA-ARS-USMARC-188]|uniref:Type I restriction-modification system specificity protein n=2 Tax=Bibersteinia trehalosi TaxID=47735 RepID=A0A4V7I734_BIBTR|nr:restriction endonuclease subunit S [Bibersteinia trehalosi]AGH39417.1 type I restriction-modification system specificity protein [Bibersteinia trehalosi USDA-ARS-USMARC-192]AHG80838.1 type I restriction-modification system specificity protein [Bibersteinia trehalosi USDA-ARS-USMARC-188]AHG82987.1 type I restriction-modification system specificity protein [Bibersteinia trehalosi USDA-ARS-USMARC-189]